MDRKKLVVFVPIIVVVLGIIGYLQEGEGAYNAILSSLKLLKVELGQLPANFFLEIARWLGILFFFGLVYAAMSAVIESGIAIAKLIQNDVVAVHGDSIYAQILKESLGRKGVNASSKVALKAPVQVLLFEDDREAISFFQENASAFKKAREVHLCLNMSCQVNIDDDNVFVTNMAEVRAIDYWRTNYCLKQEKIAIVGSGNLAEEIILWGLLSNIFDVECKNDYHAFGDFSKFQALHGDVEETVGEFGKDTISFTKETWYSNIDIVQNADRIILCDETIENVETALQMRKVGIKGAIDLFAENNNVSAIVGNAANTVGLLSQDNIQNVLIMDSVHNAGKLCHATYMMLESTQSKDINAASLTDYIHTKEFIESWKKLNSFTRGSNYASAIHDPLKYKLLLNAGLDVKGLSVEDNINKYIALDDKTRAKLQEIEHIRWSRYHLLNNWKKPNGAIVVDGINKKKDADSRLHCDLVPYSDLSDEDQFKDAYFYETLALRL